VCPAASTGVAKVAAVSNTADRSFTLRMGILQWSGEARLASSGDVRLLRHRPKETSLHALSTRREADEHRSVAWPGPESLRLVERCRPADSLNCYLLAPPADEG
jgi:hypothetical protein